MILKSDRYRTIYQAQNRASELLKPFVNDGRLCEPLETALFAFAMGDRVPAMGKYSEIWGDLQPFLNDIKFCVL